MRYTNENDNIQATKKNKSTAKFIIAISQLKLNMYSLYLLTTLN